VCVSSQYHRIGDIADEKLIETDYPGLSRNIGCDMVQWIFDISQHFESRVYIGHHAVKMNAHFVIDRQGIEKQIHQESLAATDIPP
jgi:hypothetical protein